MQEESCPKIEEINEERKANNRKELIESTLVSLDYCESFCQDKGCMYISTCPTYAKLKRGIKCNNILIH